MKSDPTSRDYWDRHVGPSNLPGDEGLTAERWTEEIAFYTTPEQECAYRFLEPITGRRILEIGSGVGVNAINLARHGAAVTALDPSFKRLAVLRRVTCEMELEAKVHPVCATAEQLPFREGVFDLAYSKSSLIHTDLRTAALECRRVLRAGGRGVFCEPTTRNPLVWFYRRFFGPQEWKSITHYFSKAEERTLNGVFPGLQSTSFHLLGFVAFYWQFGRRNLRRFRRWLRVFQAVDRCLFAVCPPLKRLAWFRVYLVERRSGGSGWS